MDEDLEGLKRIEPEDQVSLDNSESKLDRVKIYEDAQNKLGLMFDAIKNPENRAKTLLKGFYSRIDTGLLDEYISDSEQKKIEEKLRGLVDINDREEFVRTAFLAAHRLVDLKIENPDLDAAVEKAIEDKFSNIQINEKVSYHVAESGEEVYLHLAESRDVRDRLFTIFMDGLHKLADILTSDDRLSRVKFIKGTSPLLSQQVSEKVMPSAKDKTYGQLLSEKLGFNLEQAPEAVAVHFKEEFVPEKIMIISMPREKFLNKFK